jgi:LPXTG-site transpeptidase (sortase) family protein
MALPSTLKNRPWLRLVCGLLLTFGIAALGYVSYSLLDAKLFQAYQNREFDRAMRNSRPPDALTSISVPDARHHLPVEPGSTLGRIEISRLGVSVLVLEGTSGRTLRRGIGHIDGTSFPGDDGSIGLAGHRDTFFRELRNVRTGDEITLATLVGSRTYRVDAIRVVEPSAVDVLNETGESVLTLVTCYPFDFVGPAPKRLIVRAHLT